MGSTQRAVRLAGFMVTAALVLFTAPRAEAQTAPQVRMRWQDFVSGPDGAKRLASLEAAIQKMKSLNGSPKDSADYRRSWEYWANIHGYYGAQSPDGTVAQQLQWLKDNGMSQYLPYYNGITDQTPPDSVAQTVWATCQHSGQTQALNFFGWHRMYLYYYERVLRWASGDDTLRLPYWDYLDTAQVALPAAFQSTSATLYDARRDPGMNNGSSTLDPSSTDINNLLPITDYLAFESQIEQGVHGYVHCTVGPTCPVAHMGDVPVAGNDPIFYSHHGNIDRMWACWQKLHGTPAGAWQDQQFSFVDETGTLQTKPVKSFLDSTALGYVYDSDDCEQTSAVAALAAPKATPAPALPAGTRKKTALVSALKGVAINRPMTTVDLAVPRPKLESALGHLETPGNVTIVLRDVTAQGPPNVLFNVFLVKKSDPGHRQHIGTISWFGAFGGHHKIPRGPAKKTLEFDVTDKLRALGGAAAASGLSVVIEATHGRVPADPAKVETERLAVSKDFRAEAKVRIGSIEIRQAPVAAPRNPPKK